MELIPEHPSLPGKGHDRAVFAAIMGRHSPAVRCKIVAHLGARLAGKVEVEDLVQETFLRAFMGFDRLHDDSEEALSHWLSTIALHVVQGAGRGFNAKKRSLGREVRLSPPGGSTSFSLREPAARGSAAATPSTILDRKERFERLKKAIHTLSPDHRRVVVLVLVKCLSIQKAARRLERSPSATSMLLSRALFKLRKALGPPETFHLPPGSLAELTEEWSS
jgi:RNA polymerase sigma-70 factor, ECF subfamily